MIVSRVDTINKRKTTNKPSLILKSTRLNCASLVKDKDLFIGPQEFVVGYSKAPEQPQSSARPVCHSHAMTRTGREPATICTAAYGARRATHYATFRVH